MTTEKAAEQAVDDFFARPLKQQFIEALGNLPDDLTLDDAIDCLILVNEINISIAQADAGMLIPHEEVMKRMGKWLK